MFLSPLLRYHWRKIAGCFLPFLLAPVPLFIDTQVRKFFLISNKNKNLFHYQFEVEREIRMIQSYLTNRLNLQNKEKQSEIK